MSKGGSQTTETTQELPKWLTDAAKNAIEQSQQVAGIGYVPYSGPQVAAFTPMQNDAFQGTNMAAAAYGLPTSQGNGMPEPTTFADGTRGYSSMPLYEQALAQLKQTNPAQYAALTGMFAGGQDGGGQGGGNRGNGQGGGNPTARMPPMPVAPINTRSNSGYTQTDSGGKSLMDVQREIAARRAFIGPNQPAPNFGGLLSSVGNFATNPFGLRGR